MAVQLSFDILYQYSDKADGHEVTIQTFGIAFQSVIYFSKYPGLSRNLLGRIGWLRQLRLAMIDYESKLYLSQYS